MASATGSGSGFQGPGPARLRVVGERVHAVEPGVLRRQRQRSGLDAGENGSLPPRGPSARSGVDPTPVGESGMLYRTVMALASRVSVNSTYGPPW